MLLAGHDACSKVSFSSEQMTVEVILNTSYEVEQVVACVASVDAVVAVGVYLHVKLLLCLYESFGQFGCVLVVNIVIGCAVDEQ